MKRIKYILLVLIIQFSFGLNLTLHDYDNPSASHILDTHVMEDILIVVGIGMSSAMRMSRQRTHLNGVPETVRKGTLCVDRARQSSLVLAGTECGHVFITDLRLSTVLRTKSSTEEDDKDRQLEENKEERKQQKWRFR